jgi:hypothetical protein
MPTFHSTITGHLDLTRKPLLLPAAIHQVFVDDVDQPAELAQRIMERLKAITDNGGMIARLEPNHETVGKQTKRVWVPMHMLTYFESEVKATTQEMPQPDPEHEGEFVDKSGNKVRKQ